MTVRDLRQMFLEFFESKGHQRHASGSLIPVDVTGRLDESLLFNGAGMVQFKPYFRGIAQPPHPRLCNAQKCVRTGDIDEVGDLSHLTFFEMMGNFSFGDYFKQGAIDYSWEFITSTKWLNLDPHKLSVTVFETDDQAYDEWARHFASVGIDPSSRVFRLGEDTNYWPAGAFTNGPPGPCGPNTEMFSWVSDEPVPPITQGSYTSENWIKDDLEKNWLEFWNDVFIESEWQGDTKPDGGYIKTGMPDLPFKSVDTGMGLERAACVLGGYRSVYDTDSFQPILSAIQSVSGKTYGQDELSDTAMRIVADHLRTACFCIADGILPANTGRGYVLRRLIRRAVLKGKRTLNSAQPFMHHLVDSVVENFGDHYKELAEKRAVITESLRNEEALFRRTLDQGTEILLDRLESGRHNSGSVLPGDFAFMLYDTFGFPIEVTSEICAEFGTEVDTSGFNSALAVAQERSRAADQRDSVYGGVVVAFVFESEDGRATPTAFVGYESLESEGRIVGAVPVINEEGVATKEFAIALDQTPFYAESGGQVSDSGVIRLLNMSMVLTVKDLVRQDGVFVHLVESNENLGHEGASANEAQSALQENLFNQLVSSQVDKARRLDIARNHTATHLLHAALRTTLGEHVTQAGSLVDPDHLRFDFTHGKAMSPEEIKRVEQLVNEQALMAQPVTSYVDIALEDARKMGAMALFGEKYADRVRVVQIGGMPPQDPSYSRELCGGVHVKNTGEIGLFKILHESSAASGVRRIVAVTGRGAMDWANDQGNLIHQAAQKLKSTPKDMLAAIDKMGEALREERKKREKLAQSGSGSQAELTKVGPVELAVESIEGELRDAQAVADRLVDSRPDRVALVSCLADGKVVFVAKCGPGAVSSGVHAGNLVKAVASVTGGGGGGRPDFATAGGRDASKIQEALVAGLATVRSQVSAL